MSFAWTLASTYAWSPASPLALQRHASSSRPAAFSAAPVMQERAAVQAPFNVTTAVIAAGFAFEAYNEPAEQDARL